MAKKNHYSRISLNPSYLHWKTEDGRIIPICNLEDAHLQSILKFVITRSIKKIIDRSSNYDVFGAFAHPLDFGFKAHLPLSWKNLVKEARKRKLPIPALPTDKEIENIVHDNLLLQGRGNRILR